MSTPRSLVLPEGVVAGTRAGLDGDIATLSIEARAARRGRLLLISGWTGSKEDFTPVLPLLADAGYDVLAYDQAGQYESAASPDYSLEHFARNALWLAGTGTHVLGHSFGGLVAQKAALLEPTRVASLSLLDTGPGALGDVPGRPLSALVEAIGNVPMEQIHEFREKGIERPPEIAEFLRQRFISNDPASLKAMTQLLIDAPDIIDDIAALGLPVWVGRGVDDDAWPHEVQATMASRLGTRIHVIAKAAHSPAIENPEGLVAAWLPFLERHGSEGR